ncbi:CheR family methyltransferase [Thomasclavelia sp.]
MIKLTDEEFLILCTFLKENYGLNLLKKRILIEYRLMNVLKSYKVSSYTAYFKMIKEDKSGDMLEELINKITTNYTFFMRESSHFQYIKDNILPHINSNFSYSIWIAGCSSGQECYTLAMYLEDYRRSGKMLPNINIAATDINTKVLEIAKSGIYSLEEMDKLPDRWKRDYCIINSDGKTFEFKKEIKNQIKFNYHNLMKQSSIRQYHLIMCRNVLIYFDETSRSKIYHNLTNSLKPHGYLILGHAEMLPQENKDYEYLKSSIYRLKEVRLNE